MASVYLVYFKADGGRDKEPTEHNFFFDSADTASAVYMGLANAPWPYDSAFECVKLYNHTTGELIFQKIPYPTYNGGI